MTTIKAPMIGATITVGQIRPPGDGPNVVALGVGTGTSAAQGWLTPEEARAVAGALLVEAHRVEQGQWDT